MELILWELILWEDTSSFLKHSYPFTPPPTHTFTSTHTPSPTHTFTHSHLHPSHLHLHPLTPPPTHTFTHSQCWVRWPRYTAQSYLASHTAHLKKKQRVWDISMLNCNLRYFIGQCQHLYDIALFHWPVSTNTCMT